MILFNLENVEICHPPCLYCILTPNPNLFIEQNQNIEIYST